MRERGVRSGVRGLHNHQCDDWSKATKKQGQAWKRRSCLFNGFERAADPAGGRSAHSKERPL